jgi:UDP-N-acetylglucosamine 2-epimerase (non-hydrolysing)
MTVIGTRPEIIRLSCVMKRLDRMMRQSIVHTGQNYDYELNGIFFKDLDLRKPDHFLAAAGRTPAETIGKVIARADAVLEQERPDALLVLGDTNSCLAVIPAKRRRIPVFHMEAGNRCFDQRVPEEMNRRIVDHVSDVNLCYTEHARNHLLREGLPAERVIKTGSPMKEVLDAHRVGIEASRVQDCLGVVRNKYLVASIHREENVDGVESLRRILAALNGLVARYDMPMIFSTHPRTKRRLGASGVLLDPRIRRLPPLGFLDYNALQRGAFCVLSDSGTITEEASLLGFPAVMVREAHERPEGQEQGAIVLGGLNPGRLQQAVEMTRHQFDTVGPLRVPTDYLVDQVSWTVAKIILGYTDLVKRTVWFQGSPDKP